MDSLSVICKAVLKLAPSFLFGPKDIGFYVFGSEELPLRFLSTTAGRHGLKRHGLNFRAAKRAENLQSVIRGKNTIGF
jgi:hypothetical protein